MSDPRPHPRAARAQRGFSLPEVLIALTVVTLISFMVIGALGPWLGLKQRVDNDRRLQDVRQALYSLYDTRAFEAELDASAALLGLRTSTVTAPGNCQPQDAQAFRQLTALMSGAGGQDAKDGYGNPWCFFVSAQIQRFVDGAPLFFHNVAVVSAGSDSLLSPETRMRADGVMEYGGDDNGVAVSGFDIQHPKLKETLRRLTRAANLYETYFSLRFISYADRDITRDYFSAPFDPSNPVPSTAGAWGGASTVLRAIGLSAGDSFSAWADNNEFLVGNHSEQMNGQQVRSPATTGTGILPYTALLAARLPSPAAAPAYASRVAVGNY